MMAKATPKISVIERRLQGPNVFRESSQPIPLADPKTWTVRWVDTRISPDHLWNTLHQKGWEYVVPEDLACPVEEIGAQVQNGRIVRGERGAEVLLKMPTKDYRRVEKAKTAQTLTQTFGKKPLKDAIVAQAAEEHGDRAAEYLHEAVNSVTVTDRRAPEDAA